MKKRLVYTSQFKKDFKRYRHRREIMETLREVFIRLENGMPIPYSMRPHKLTGNYKGCMECHVGNDILLIWIDEKTNVVRLLRFGSHSELF